MALSYGFFDSINDDRLYNADDISNYFVKLITNGVFATPASAMQVQANSGMTVKVSAGWGFISCKWVHNDAPYILTLDAPDMVLNRIDRIVLRLDTRESGRNITIGIHKGTAAATPTAPTLTRANGVYELSLAQVYVAANAAAISQIDITDERGNTSVCGYVTGLIDQIDTTNLFAQYNAAFRAELLEFTDWWDGVRESVFTATNTVRKYERTATTSGTNTSAMSIGIAAYSPNDILNVYVNGIRLADVVDYTVSGDTVTFTNALDVDGTPVTFEVIKSIDSTDVTTALDYVENRMGGVSFVTCSQSEYDAMTEHPTTTVYFVFPDEDQGGA